MTITATAIYENGVLKLSRPLPLPEKTRMRIYVEPEVEEAATEEGHILYDLLALAKDLGVHDLAEQHDHYLYGVEKQ